MVAPDQRLTGIAKNSLNASFDMLLNDDYRLEADLLNRDALRRNGLILQNNIYSPKDKKLYAMAVSCTFCVLRLSTAVFEDLHRKMERNKSASDTLPPAAA